MAVPKKKPSKARTSRRRATYYKAIKVTTVKCPNCGEPMLPHHVCLNCGYYNGKQVLEVKE
ncbi:50S ribosomal protein L32 [Mesoaciditoga sp.]|jgi:large subunit ribosomal protein L32